MSSMKGGFSTLNRFFGRKKGKSFQRLPKKYKYTYFLFFSDKSGSSSSSIGKLSKSTTQLHHLSTDTDINETSQLEYNRITPVPAATSNAPFEQTFRITVLLPKDQLFVARLGARVPLSKLLALVCDNKQLDADKYEFRSPVDASQVYSCESTIGAVGLSEIRLCHKSESYDNFNPDAMHKFHRTGVARDSLSSSSDFSSSRNSKITAKTPSPYSSSNSLNSMDSTGMNYTRTPVVVPPAKVLAPPPRKKRTAPRPPSQICIPEQSVPEIPSNPPPAAAPPLKSEPAYAVIVKRPQLCMSTPNLSAHQELDCNGNSAKTVAPRQEEDSPDGHYATLDLKPLATVGGPEPTPRKRLIQIKKKTAPAPPPEHSTGGDTISLASLPEVVTPTNGNAPQPAPRITTPLPVAPAAIPPLSPPVVEENGHATAPVTNGNVSKVMLNRTPTPEPRSLGSAAEEDDNDAASKQADSGIGEPAPSPSPEPELEMELENKSQPESSSEDDEAIKVYNFKLCKTSSQTKGPEPPRATSLAELAALSKESEEDEEPPVTVAANGQRATTPGSASEQTSLSSWNYSVPISPPPDFSDAQAGKGSRSPGSPLDDIVDELSAIINQQKLDTLIKKQPDPRATEIEAAKPNRLANFSIATAKTTTRVARADSFQAEAEKVTSPGSATGLSLRSTSHVSLNKLEQNGYPLGQRRSSSELSIGESPSLQSLEVIKTILNSRKNSLAESGGSPSPVEQPKIPSPTVELTKEQNSIQVEAKSPLSKPTASPVQKKKEGLSPLLVQKAQIPMVSKKESPSPVPLKKPVTAPVLVQQTKQPSPVPIVKQEKVDPVKQSPPPVAKKVVEAPQSPPPVVKEIPKEQSPAPVVKQVTKAQSPAPEPSSSAAPLSPVALRVTNEVVETAAPAPQPQAKKEEPESAPGSKPLPPTYRYSGPPSINFATWSERPKSQVAIKNEGDYIFGGAGKSQAVNSPPAKLTIEVASPILRMGIPQRKEYHVPITVKPLKDVVPEVNGNQVEQEKEVPKPQEAPVPVQAAAATQVRAPTQVQSSTLPRPAKTNRFTLPAGNQVPVVTTATSNTSSLPRPVSTLERKKPTVEVTPAPFGQNTLRRTGFKERMLAKEQQEQEQARAPSTRVTVNGTAAVAPAPAPAPAPAAVQVKAPVSTSTSPPATSPKPVPAAKNGSFFKTTKVEVKLQQETKAQPEPVSLQVKLRPTSQPAVQVAVPPPPPPQMGLALKPLKPSQGRSASAGNTPTTPDPRSQLLEAIRNFKREELNRS
ncbi:hypothetical protein KR018_012329 [Drosophila ironensis]|nr:hypothetical protein KR018_012329 [Drosophila ironensis]